MSITYYILAAVNGPLKIHRCIVIDAIYTAVIPLYIISFRFDWVEFLEYISLYDNSLGFGTRELPLSGVVVILNYAQYVPKHRTIHNPHPQIIIDEGRTKDTVFSLFPLHSYQFFARFLCVAIQTYIERMVFYND